MVTLDNDGFIWCATDKGLAMFNGEKFKIYTTRDGLPVNDLWAIYATDDGKMWYFGRSNELGYIENGRIFKFPTDNGMIMNPVNFDIVGSKISIVTPVETYYLVNGKWKNSGFELHHKLISQQTENHALCLFSNVPQNIIISIENNNLVHLDTNLNIIGKFKILGEWIAHSKHIPKSLFIDKRFFYCMISDRLVIYDIPNKKVNTILMERFFDRADFNELNMNYDGKNLFVDGPAGRYVLKNNSLVLLIPPIELANSRASGFFLDSLDNIWVNTLNNGIYKCRFYDSTSRMFCGKNVQHICFHNKRVYLGVENEGLYKINGVEAEKIPTKGKYFYEINSLNDTTLLVLTSSEIAFFKNSICSIPNIEGIFYKGITQRTVWSMVRNAKTYLNYKGIAYISQGRNFVVYGGNKNVRYEFPGIYHITRYMNYIVLGTTMGIRLFDGHSIKYVGHLNSTSINKFLVMGHQLFIATEGKGLLVYDGSLKSVKGTEDFVVNDIWQFDDNTLWISTNLGAHELKRNSGTYSITRSVLRSNGLASNWVNDLLVEGDTLYCATNNGLSILPLSNLVFNNKPNIVLAGITINDSVYYGTDEIIVRNRGRNNLSVLFDIAYLSEHIQLKNYYKIDPLDKEWIPLESNSFILNGLRLGKYTIRIKTEGFNGNMNEKSFVLIIKPRWYERIEFILVIVFLGLGVLAWLTWKIITLIIKRRNQKYILENKLVNMELHALRSKLNPHFIFNTFGSIQLYINNNQLELSEKYLILLSKHIRNVFEYSHLQNISLEKEISLLNDYLEIEKTRFGDKIHIDIKVDPHLNIKSRLIPAMLIQPFVENSMVHGLFHKEGVGNLLIAFTYVDASSYEVKIADDGIGFVEKSSQRLSSTKVTNERVNLINQAKDFNVKIEKSYLDETKVEKGTVITILIKNLHDEGHIGR
jgi:hypothetical protein